MTWIKVDTNLRSHRKIFRAASLLEVRQAEAIGCMVGLWGWAIDNAPDGVIEGADMVAFAAQWTGEAKHFVDALLAVGLLDDAGDDCYHIHDWEHYSGALIESRRRKAKRERQRRTQPPRGRHDAGTTPTRRGHAADTTPTRTAQSYIPGDLQQQDDRNLAETLPTPARGGHDAGMTLPRRGHDADMTPAPCPSRLDVDVDQTTTAHTLSTSQDTSNVDEICSRSSKSHTPRPHTLSGSSKGAAAAAAHEPPESPPGTAGDCDVESAETADFDLAGTARTESAQLVHPDGTVEDAPGIIWPKGEPTPILGLTLPPLPPDYDDDLPALNGDEPDHPPPEGNEFWETEEGRALLAANAELHERREREEREKDAQT